MVACTRRQKKNADRLSSLPPEILLHILSLMPTKSAVKTSILSKQWRYSWTLVYNLDFDDIRPLHGKECFLEFVDRVLKLCKTSKLELFRLNISRWAFPKSTYSEWISEAVKRNVCELDIQVRKLHLPLSLFTCKTLTRFRLHFFPRHGSQSRALWDCPSVVTLPCLKTLDVMVYSNPFDTVFKLIHGCPALENLSLEITRRNSADDYCFEIPTLKRLTLSIFSSISAIHRVVLNVPNLEYLCVSQQCLQSLFVIKDLSSLVEAKSSCGIVCYHLWAELLKGISGAKYLSSHITILRPHSYPLNFPLPEFPNVKRLEFDGYYGRDCLLILQILENCSELEHLCINMAVGSFWNEEPQALPGFLVTNLKTLTVTSVLGHENDMRFLRFVLANLKVLKRLTVMFRHDVPPSIQKASSRDISMLPRASEDCQFHFLRKRLDPNNIWYF